MRTFFDPTRTFPEAPGAPRLVVTYRIGRYRRYLGESRPRLGIWLSWGQNFIFQAVPACLAR